MYNDLLRIGPVTVHGYGLMIAIGVIMSYIIADKRVRNRHMDQDILYYLMYVCAGFGFLGAKLMFVIVEFRSFLQDPAGIFFSSSGFVVYGGIIGGVLAGYVYCRIKKAVFLQYFDIILPTVAIAQGFGRIGCFLAGCCYGRPTDAWYGIAFHNSFYAPNGIKMIPVQLFSAGGMFAIGAFLLWYALKPRPEGKVGALYLILYSAGRFGMEFLRNDHRGEIGPLSTSQFISLFILAIGMILFVTRKDTVTKKEEA